MAFRRISSLFHKYEVVMLLFALLVNVLIFQIIITPHILESPDSEHVEGESSVEFLSLPWYLAGNKELSEKREPIDPKILQGKDTLVLTYNTHGLCLLGGKASQVIFENTKTSAVYAVSLSSYGKNCYNGEQKISIPLNHFIGLSKRASIDSFGISFWYPTNYLITIKSAVVTNAVLGTQTMRKIGKRKTKPVSIRTAFALFPPTPLALVTAMPTLFATPSATAEGALLTATHPSWPIQSVSSMKETKDRVCDQRSQQFIEQWVDQAKLLGANYVSVETPYDDPSCGSSLVYTRTWVTVIRSRGLKVWHRSMPLAFEGIYNVAKNPSADYLQMIAAYIKNNPSLYQAGDIFTPIPEPQNGGIYGVNYCSNGICMFPSAVNFNLWLRNALLTSQRAFETIGLKDKIHIGYFGFDGFIAWGDNNPDWHGILEDATIAAMGNITIDHYPEVVGDTMQNDLNELQARYPNIPIIIGEWGTITGGNSEQQVRDSMGAAVRPHVAGFNYWHFGMGGNEALLNEDFTHRPQFVDVQSFYKSTR